MAGSWRCAGWWRSLSKRACRPASGRPPIERKRTTQISGLEVAPLDSVLARYRAAVDMKNEMDPDFVISRCATLAKQLMAEWEECLRRIKAYE